MLGALSACSLKPSPLGARTRSSRGARSRGASPAAAAQPLAPAAASGGRRQQLPTPAFQQLQQQQHRCSLHIPNSVIDGSGSMTTASTDEGELKQGMQALRSRALAPLHDVQLTKRAQCSSLTTLLPASPLCYGAEHDERVASALAAAAAAGVKLQPSQEVLDIIRGANAFTFDVDSTL